MADKKTNYSEKVNKLESNPVRVIRKELGLTQSELAEKLGVTDKYISFVENGKKQFSKKLVRKLLELAPAGIRPEWLLGYDPYKTEDEVIAADIKKSKSLGEAETVLLNKAAQIAGYRIEVVERKTELNLDDISRLFVDAKGHKTGLSSIELSELVFDIQEYAAFRLEQTLHKKGAHILIDLSDAETEGNNGKH